jgi:hypothetical protein
VRVALLYGQIIVGLERTVSVGPGSTEIVITAEFVQLPEAPIAVYVVVEKGVTVWGLFV